MKLSSLLQELRSRENKWAEYDTYVIEVSQIAAHGPDADYAEYPILDVDIEYEDKEITFVTNQLAQETQAHPKPMRLQELALRLVEVEKECSSFHLFSGTSIFPLGEDYYGRRDMPISAFGWNEEDKRFGLVHEKDKAQEAAKKKWWQFWKLY